MQFFDQLKQADPAGWRAYTRHAFVEQMAAGTLPRAAFQYYLSQDYIFLIHFARAYGLAVYKSDNLADMRAAAATLSALLEVEMELHVGFCKDWGLSRADMARQPEDPANMAYTRFVLECGASGDILDLLTALIPCVAGYAEIGSYLAGKDIAPDNPYRNWIDMYAGDEYQSVAQDAIAQLQRLAEERLTEPRRDKLIRLFGQAVTLEINFWQMGLDAV